MTAGEIVGALADEVSLAESTVRTMLGILKEKEYVRASARGRAFVYHAIVDQSTARRSVVRYLVSRIRVLQSKRPSFCDATARRES